MESYHLQPKIAGSLAKIFFNGLIDINIHKTHKNLSQFAEKKRK